MYQVEIQFIILNLFEMNIRETKPENIYSLYRIFELTNQTILLCVNIHTYAFLLSFL